MEQALQTRPTEQAPAEPVSREHITKYLNTFGLANELSDMEKQQFVEIAEAYQLNPFKREIYAVPYGEGEYRRLSIITGYEVFIKRAERTGKLDGWHAYVEGETEDNFKAVIEIFRKDWSHPFRHEVYWKEAVQRKRDGSLTQFWKKMPRFQLRKVCISQGFRLCFPDELGGMPYDSSELPEEMTMRDVSQDNTPATSEKPTEQEGPATEKNATTPLMEKLSGRLRSHEECFSENHLNWIKSQMENDPSDENVKKLAEHVEEVIKNKTVIKPLKRMANTAKQKEAAVQKKEAVPIF